MKGVLDGGSVHPFISILSLARSSVETRSFVAVAQRSVLRIVNCRPRNLDLDGLISSMAAGDESALARFHDATGGLLFGLLLLILGETSTAEEVLAEVYAEVTQRASQFDQNQETLLTWLVTIAHRHALERLCSSNADQSFLISVGLAVPLNPGRLRRFGISRGAHRRLVSATLNALSPVEQKMIELAYFSRMTPLEVGMRLRQSPDTVKTGLQNGISQLYNLFKCQGFVSQALAVVDSDRKPA
jgi:RNA polymerase sigma-70 factor (ECF subfamily)